MKKKLVALVMAVTMVVGMSMTSMAAPASEQEFKGQGYLTNQPESGDGGMVDISVSADSFLWYANSDTETSPGSGVYDIKSADYKITNHSDEVNLKVTLVEYKPVTTSNALSPYQNDIELNLTKRLEDSNNSKLGQDLLRATLDDYAGEYTERLAADTSWTFAFGGTYTGTLPDAVADYVLVLEFEAVSINIG